MVFTQEEIKAFVEKHQCWNSRYKLSCEARESIYADEPRFQINFSSILTKLIQEAGRWCVSYASDLFIDWTEVLKSINEEDPVNRIFLFGFRESGVDHAAFILQRYETYKQYAHYEYRALYALKLTFEDHGDLVLTMELEELSRY